VRDESGTNTELTAGSDSGQFVPRHCSANMLEPFSSSVGRNAPPVTIGGLSPSTGFRALRLPDGILSNSGKSSRTETAGTEWSGATWVITATSGHFSAAELRQMVFSWKAHLGWGTFWTREPQQTFA
jgi:hypothetical protein